jgi:hypothetical protein
MRPEDWDEPTFIWRPTSWIEHNFILAMASDPTAELAVLSIGGTSPTIARLEARDCQLAFVKAALPRPSILVYDTNRRTKLAEFEWRGQQLRLPAVGRQFRWRRSSPPLWRPTVLRDVSGFLRPGYVIVDHHGPLIHFCADGRIRCAYPIPVPPDMDRLSPSLLALLALGWILITMSREKVA